MVLQVDILTTFILTSPGKVDYSENVNQVIKRTGFRVQSLKSTHATPKERLYVAVRA